MASRITLQEAQNLKAELQVRHSHAEFRIVDNSNERRIGRKAAEAKGYQIIEDGRITVLAMVTRFDVLEIRRCQCGAEILTAAIGELGLDECPACQTKRQARFQKELKESCQRNADHMAAWDAMDEWEES